MEQVQAVFQGAETAKAPVIIALTPAARRYAGVHMLSAMIKAAEQTYKDVVYAVHLDHGDSEHCFDAISSGEYNSVMIDASHEVFEKNVEITKTIVEKAHTNHVTVEAELGVLSGLEDDLSVTVQESLYTDPQQAHEFVHRTGCDSLAVAVGTSHGAYKFSGGQGLQLDILKKIAAIMHSIPLVLHGASAVPFQEIERINRTGGTLKTTAKGVSEADLQDAIALGVCKINIATDARLIWCRVHREFFMDKPELFDPLIPGKTYIQELAEFVVRKCTLLGAKGHVADFV
jgi:fructose-bisphosphate aldolase class II